MTQIMDAEKGEVPTENQVIPYEAPWNIFAVAFSNNPDYPFRMGVASFLAETTNHVEIIQLNEERKFEKKVTFDHRYPPTKILFNPDLVNFIKFRLANLLISLPLLERASKYIKSTITKRL